MGWMINRMTKVPSLSNLFYFSKNMRIQGSFLITISALKLKVQARDDRLRDHIINQTGIPHPQEWSNLSASVGIRSTSIRPFFQPHL